MEDRHESHTFFDLDGRENANEENNTEGQSPKRRRRSRGPSRLKKLEGKGPFPLEWDRTGCPTGQYATSFASYCGKRVRSQVNINFNDWDKDVDAGLKNLLWEDISKKYEVHERNKDYVLTSCGNKWRDFKGKLTQKWIRKKHPKYDSPADYYTYIEHADWEKFKMNRETAEFKEKSKKAIASIKHNEHPHLMGRRGYSQRIPQWIAESSESSSLAAASSLVSDRSWRWIKGRTKADGKIPNENTQKVAEQMVQWRQKMDSGEFIPNRYDDLLSRSTNKLDHPGRVRAFSTGVTLKDVFGAAHRTPQRSVSMSQLEVAEISQRVVKETVQSLGSLIRQETAGILKRMGLQVPEDLNEQPQSSCQSIHADRSARMSKETHTTFDPKLLKEPTKCKLVSVHGGVDIIVAEGTVYPFEDINKVLHSTPLLAGHMKVSIDLVLEGRAPLPVPTQYIERVADALGSFIQWPKELIKLGQESFMDTPQVASKGKQVSKGSSIKSPSKSKFDDCMLNIGSKCEELRAFTEQMPIEAKVFEVVLPSNMFHFDDDKSIVVTGDDIDMLFRMRCLNVECIQLFMVFLDQLCKEMKDEGLASVGFMCPNIVSQIGDDKVRNQQVMNYVEKSLFKMNGFDIILVPFKQQMHWKLVILRPRTQEAFFCDPMSSKKYNATFKFIINGAFLGFKAKGGPTLRGGLTLKWNMIVCHQQQLEGTECSYYVMRYMLDVVRRYRKTKDCKQWFGSKVPYSCDEINEVRDLWATYLMENQ